MTSIFDETLLRQPDDLEEQRFSLVRRSGKLVLKARSPLFERVFKALSKDVISQSNLWNGLLYTCQIDPNIEQLLNSMGCSLKYSDTFWRQGTHFGVPTFNLTFLMAKGLSEGLAFPIKDNVPLSLIEGPEFIFANTLRKGIYAVAKNFAVDYEVNVQMLTNTKVKGL
jgi:hypothetical protein